MARNLPKVNDSLRTLKHITGHINFSLRTGPLWKGPEDEGVTFSLLSRWLSCKERFRIHTIEGLRTEDEFNHKMEYGNMWHICEEALAAGDPTRRKVSKFLWELPLLTYVLELCKRYSMSRSQIEHWYRVCQTQFPLYVEHWRKHADVTSRKPLLQEEVFSVPYRLPSGRVVILRGKFDSVDLIGRGKEAGIYLQENKTKGDIKEEQLKRQLTFDLQTMIYLVALERFDWTTKFDIMKSSSPRSIWDGHKIKGVRYNVIRRPLSGGRGSISRHKATKTKSEESLKEFYERLSDIIGGSGENSPGPDYFFMRWKVEVTPGDVKRFQTDCLDPMLENLCWWYEEVSGKPHGKAKFPPTHWRHPFGVRNVLDEGGSSDLDNYLDSGSTVGLRKVDNLFPELEST